jgi:hypothetical protein
MSEVLTHGEVEQCLLAVPPGGRGLALGVPLTRPTVRTWQVDGAGEELPLLPAIDLLARRAGYRPVSDGGA